MTAPGTPLNPVGSFRPPEVRCLYCNAHSENVIDDGERAWRRCLACERTWSVADEVRVRFERELGVSEENAR